MDHVERLYELSQILAKAVCHKLTSLEDAYAHLMNSALAAELRGELDQNGSNMTVRGMSHTLRIHINLIEADALTTKSAIERAVAPMIMRREPKNVLLAEAHGVNGANGFPLSEKQVYNIVTDKVYWSMPTRRGSRVR